MIRAAMIIPTILVMALSAEEGVLEEQTQARGGERGDLNLNKAYLELFYNKEEIRGIRAKSEIIDRELEGTAELSESFKPLEKALATVDKIYLHPKRSVTVMFPATTAITRITSTFDTKFIEYDEANPTNLFTVLSMPAFVSGDLTVYYTLDGKKRVMKIICEKYSQGKDSAQTYYSVVAYKEPGKLEPFEVMEAYKKEYGTYPLQRYSFITVGGVAYKIIEDAQYGRLTAPNGKKYRIETQVNQRN